MVEDVAFETFERKFDFSPNLLEESSDYYEGDLNDHSQTLDNKSVSSKSSQKSKKKKSKRLSRQGSDSSLKSSRSKKSSKSTRKKTDDLESLDAIIGKSVGQLDLLGQQDREERRDSFRKKKDKKSPKSRKSKIVSETVDSTYGMSEGYIDLFDNEGGEGMKLERRRSESNLGKLKKNKSDRSLKKDKRRSETPKSSKRKTLMKTPKTVPLAKSALGEDGILDNLTSLDLNDDDAKSERKKRSKALKKERSDKSIGKIKKERSDKSLGKSPSIRKKSSVRSLIAENSKTPKKKASPSKGIDNLAKFEMLLGKAHGQEEDVVYDEESVFEEEEIIEEKPRKIDSERKKKNLAKFEQMFSPKEEDIIYDEETVFEEEEEIIEEKPKKIDSERKHNNLAKFEQMFGRKEKEDVIYDEEESVFEEEEIIEEKPKVEDKNKMREGLKKSSDKFEEMLRKAYYDSCDDDETIIEEEDLSEDGDVMDERPIPKKRDEDVIKSMRKSFQDMHTSRKAAMLQMITAVPKQVPTTVTSKDEDEDEQEEDDDEYEDQVIEKWFRKDSLPEDLETACKELIPIVYKGENVNVDTMMRRTPLPELYKYLRQHLDYKQMKEKSNLNKFEKMFESAMNDSFGNLDYKEETIEIDDDLENLSSHAIRERGGRDKRKERKKQKEAVGGNHDKFEELLRRAHAAKDSGDTDSDSGDSFEEEEVVVVVETATDKKLSNLAKFEQMVGGFEEEEVM